MKLARLHAKFGGRCLWCSIPTKIAPGPHARPFPDMATRDHLDEKWTGRRNATKISRMVLACYACNSARGAAPQEGKPHKPEKRHPRRLTPMRHAAGLM